MPPPSGPRDPSDVEGELVALLAGWVADVRPEIAPAPTRLAARRRAAASASSAAEPDRGRATGRRRVAAPVRSLLEYEDAEPVAITRGRPPGTRAYLLRAAAGAGGDRAHRVGRGRALLRRAPRRLAVGGRQGRVPGQVALRRGGHRRQHRAEHRARRAGERPHRRGAGGVPDRAGPARRRRRRRRPRRAGPPARLPHHAAQRPRATPRPSAPSRPPRARRSRPARRAPRSRRAPRVTPGATRPCSTPTSSPRSVLAAPSGEPLGDRLGVGGRLRPAAGGSSGRGRRGAPARDPAACPRRPPSATRPRPTRPPGSSAVNRRRRAAARRRAARRPGHQPARVAPSPEPPAPTSRARGPGHPAQSTPEPARRQRWGRWSVPTAPADRSPRTRLPPAPEHLRLGRLLRRRVVGATGSEQPSTSSATARTSASDGGQRRQLEDATRATAAAGAEISVDGLAGSTLGAVTGVVASTAGSA